MQQYCNARKENEASLQDVAAFRRHSGAGRVLRFTCIRKSFQGLTQQRQGTSTYPFYWFLPPCLFVIARVAL